MFTVQTRAESRYRINGSKFLGWLLPARSREHIETALEEIRSVHPQATHHCYAWRLLDESSGEPVEMAQDDGEPSGTAGTPILNQLRSADLVQCTCIIVRYYGGTKLGTSGLIDAYGHTTELSIQAARLQKIEEVFTVEIRYDYSEQSLLDQWTHNYRLKEAESHYGATVTRQLHCPADQIEAFRGQLAANEWRLLDVREIGRSWRSAGDR